MIEDQTFDITKVGNVAICKPSRKIQNITYVLYSPSILKNLILVDFLGIEGITLNFDKNKCILKDKIKKIIDYYTRRYL